jgi:hypothetical protein
MPLPAGVDFVWPQAGGGQLGPSVRTMNWECPDCEREFETYREADSHGHQTFTEDDAEVVFDIELPPTHPKVTASLSRRLKFRLRQLLR